MNAYTVTRRHPLSALAASRLSALRTWDGLAQKVLAKARHRVAQIRHPFTFEIDVHDLY